MIRAILCPDFDPPLKNILFELAWCIVDSAHIKQSLITKQNRSHKETFGKIYNTHTHTCLVRLYCQIQYSQHSIIF